MFESHFGLSGPPFQLNADPAFFFGSRGHNHALAYMRFGVHQAEGFIVVTGEVGAGKTTLVRTLMASLEQDSIVAAQVVSTQLEAGDLLRAILAAFGVSAPPAASKAQLISSLEAYLTALAAQGRRALLVIDEAQNLDRTAVEELRMLSNFQLGTHGLLQSFLVGQPELRQLLQSRSMEQLRQRVIASCHLGPLDEAETRGYVEHRLKHVGWVDKPRFSDEAFGQIYRATGGIPRRVNRLCGRLLLGAFLEGRDDINAQDVIRTSQELNAEIGEADAPPALEAHPVLSAPSVAPGAADGKAPEPERREVDVVARTSADRRGALLCWVDSVSDYLRAGVLSRSFASDPAMPLVIAVYRDGLEGLESALGDGDGFARPDVDIGLESGDAKDADRVSVLGRTVSRFSAVLAEIRPVALALLGSSNEALLCGMLAQRTGVPLLRADAGRVSWSPADPLRTNVVLLDRLADLVYTENLVSYHALHKSGVASDRLQCVGDLMGDVIHQVGPRLPSVDEALKAIGPAGQRLRRGAAFGVVTCAFDLPMMGAIRAEQLLASLVQSAAELPLLWLLDEVGIDALKSTGMMQRLGSSSLVVVPQPSYRHALALIARASILICGAAPKLLDEAVALGLPCVVADAEGGVLVRSGDAQETHRPAQGLREIVREVCEQRPSKAETDERRAAWDGGAVPRVTTHLGSWLRGRSAEASLRSDLSGTSAGAGA